MTNKKQQSLFDRATLIGSKYAKQWLAVVLVFGISILGYAMLHSSSAASGGTIYLSPASGTYRSGDLVTVDIHETSGTVAINAVQTEVNYDSAKVQIVSVNEAVSFPTVAATDTSIPNIVRLARGTLVGTSVSGDQVVATLVFKVVANSGSISLGINNTFSLIVQASDNTNILATSTGSTFQIGHGQSKKK